MLINTADPHTSPHIRPVLDQVYSALQVGGCDRCAVCSYSVICQSGGGVPVSALGCPGVLCMLGVPFQVCGAPHSRCCCCVRTASAGLRGAGARRGRLPVQACHACGALPAGQLGRGKFGMSKALGT